ncbi:hypothetical protein D9757_004994 [Collybiopsis confluens]|uniref:Uncharacterized protein n=1 Tax=Collybiopsis confluens TaxID=2823264 RepID=A0A8H5HT95_9AGAR|nr:hypothetical protein D9757_004994 [Collybiopsis confluens]
MYRPVFAALTDWHEVYHDIVRGGGLVAEFDRLHRLYGPVIRVGPNKLHFNDRRAYHDIYGNATLVKEPGFYHSITVHAPQGSAALIDPDESKKRRGLLGPSFSRQAVIQLGHTIQEKVDQFIALLTEHHYSPETAAKVSDAYRSLTTDIITEYCFADSTNTLAHPNFCHPMVTSVRDFVKRVWIQRHFPFIVEFTLGAPQKMILWLLPAFKSHIAMKEKYENQIDDLINDPSALSATDHETIYHHLLNPKDPGMKLSKSTLAQEAFTLLAAGSDTVGHVSTVGTYFALKDRSILRRLTEELVEAWPDKGRPMSFVALEKLPFLTAFIKEALRISLGIVHPLPRVVGHQGTEICGLKIPPGTIVAINRWCMHMDAETFDEPYAFNPNRWMAGDSKEMMLNFVPFSKGPHMCLGLKYDNTFYIFASSKLKPLPRSLAWSELYLIFGNIFRRLDLTLIEGNQNHDFDLQSMSDYVIPQWQKFEYKGDFFERVAARMSTISAVRIMLTQYLRMKLSTSRLEDELWCCHRKRRGNSDPSTTPIGTPDLRALRAQVIYGTPPVGFSIPPNIPPRTSSPAPSGPFAETAGTPRSFSPALNYLSPPIHAGPSGIKKAKILRRHLVSKEERERNELEEEAPSSVAGKSRRSSGIERTEEENADEPFPVPYAAPGADVTHDIYKWNLNAQRQARRVRSVSFSAASQTAPEPAFEHIHEPGGFRRNYVLLHAQAGHEEGNEEPRAGEDLEEEEGDKDEDVEGLYAPGPSSSTVPAPGFGDLYTSESSPLLGKQPLARSRSRSRRRTASISTGNATVGQAILMLLKGFVGTGVLFLGKAEVCDRFMNGGILFSALLFVFIAVISLHSFLLLVRAKLAVPGSFGDIGGVLYGPWMRQLILTSIVVSQIGFVCAYMIFVSENLQAFVSSVTNCVQYVPVNSEINLVASRGARDVQLFNPKDFSLFVGTAVFSFEGIGLIVPIVDAMREPHKFPAVLTGVMAFLTVLFGGSGVLAYLTFGSDIKTVILVNLNEVNPGSRMLQVVQFFYSVAILLSVPLQLFPAVRIMENGLFTRSGKSDTRVKWTKNSFRFATVILSGFIAVAGAKDLDKFVAFIGCFACVPLCYVYPAMLHYKACAHTRKQRMGDIAMMVFAKSGRAPAGAWDSFNFAPSNRIFKPNAVHDTFGSVDGAQNLLGNATVAGAGAATITGNGSYVVLDFGQEVGGRLSFQIVGRSSANVALSYTESRLFISPTTSDTSCQSNPAQDLDGVLSLPGPSLGAGNESYVQSVGDQRGGFRFLTIVSRDDVPVTISNLVLHATFMPQMEDLKAYSGYFYARDTSGFHDPDFLTKLWYGGAYTVQMNTIDPHEAREFPCPLPTGWANNATGGPVEGTILVDGAKRDRTVWPGDMGISTHTELVSTFDLETSKNSLLVMFSTQDPATGALQYSGPPINAVGSDTYICWSLIGTHTVYLYTGDLDFVRTVWANYTFALEFLQSQVDETGLMNVPVAFSNDWGREGGQGHNVATNALLYETLLTAAELASVLGDSKVAGAYASNASSIKTALNELLWDEAAGMFKDNDTSTTLHPQDGNSYAIVFNLTNNASRIQSISEGLTQFWTDIGPLSPEINDTIIPFIGGFELQAHFIAGQGERALDLLHREWGYILYTNISVHSTMLEGYTANGSLGYRASEGYQFDHSDISHAHGWATGPTFSLTFHLVGMTITSPQGATWSVAPVLSGLHAAQGGFGTDLGWFGANWTLTDSTVFLLAIDTPKGTRGGVTLPGTGRVSVDGVHKEVEGKAFELEGGPHVVVLHMLSSEHMLRQYQKHSRWFLVARAPAGPWDAFNFAPSGRLFSPKAVYDTVGQVLGAENLVGNASSSNGATITGAGSYVVLDFGLEVGGRVSFQINATSSSAVALAFTESAEFISPTTSDDSCQVSPSEDRDGVLSVPTPLTGIETFTQTIGDQRGGFRFLTIVSRDDAPVTISNINLNATFMPQFEDLNAYTGYFYAQDTTGFHDPDFLTKLWYGGAYTVQTNTIDVHEARQQPCPAGGGWANNATGGPIEGTILVDGAKRDRNVWPGDMGISTHTELVSTFDLESSKNSLLVMFSTQDRTTGALQYSGPPINAHGSDTYITWSLIGTHTVYLYTGDLDFVKQVWANYTFALEFLQSQVDQTGLMNVPNAFANDWGRNDGQGHNIAANVLLYETLVTASELATALGNSSLARAYTANATSVKAAINDLLWDEGAGLFKDNDASTLHPQDGNSLAVLFNATNNASQIQSISEGLTQFWTDIGPLSPELNDTIIPFVGGFELQAHFIAGQGERALDLLHREWGYMLYTNLSVQSTMLEGFTANGSLGYRSAAGYNFDHSYTSHAHGWSTGPTFSLTFHLVGLTITSPQGATWSVAPVLSGLDAAQGGFETGLGSFGADWTLANNKTFTITVNTPSGTKGTVTLPGAGEVSVDGKPTRANGNTLALSGGKHTVVLNM